MLTIIAQPRACIHGDTIEVSRLSTIFCGHSSIAHWAPSAHEVKKRSERSFTFLHALANCPRVPKIIRDQVVSVVLAGRDTIAATLSWAFYELSHYRKIYAHPRAEILDKVGPTSASAHEDLKNMPYLKHTINETLRLYPAVPYNIRSALSDTTLPTGGGPNGDLPITVLQGGLGGLLNIRHAAPSRPIHTHLREVFADPNIFSPERFEKWSPRPWQYSSVNGGPRICIG